ncbi:helix-turn-helix transcriptional regulator [Dermacoccus nishinomiyaensis]|uniref:helix-turn-helix transcriptional regulator n=1 Tax=Dermacoccus nishinomiyaensis TaxID=1274 RepID=UPI0011C04307|nr:helix-turn-helix transcriptional regulator [Dermacoccus nishinomiyaensis]QQY23825.1 helix-turn-helix transcriptional regulator [Dermacoccus nishinomiyaensis]
MTDNEASTEPMLLTPWEDSFRQQMEQLRRAAGLTQRDLAKALKTRYDLAFHQQTVQRIEDGKRPVRLNEGFAIADLLGVPLDSMASASARADVQSARYAVERLRRTFARAGAGVDDYLAELEEDIEATFYVVFPDGYRRELLDHLSAAESWALAWVLFATTHWQRIHGARRTLMTHGGLPDEQDSRGGLSVIGEVMTIRRFIERERPDLHRLLEAGSLEYLKAAMDDNAE